MPKPLFALIGIPFCLAANVVLASTIVGSASTPAKPTVVNLTAHGTTDWAKYSTSNADTIFVHDVNGSGAISDVSGVNGASYVGSPADNPTFSWTNGTPVLSGSAFSGEVSLIAGAGAGLSFTVVATGAPEVLDVYLGNYQTDATVTASLLGATSYVDSFSTFNGTVPTRDYTIAFSADNPGDLLTFSFLRNSGETNSTLVLYATTLEVVPEPPSKLLILLGMTPLSLLVCRRSRAKKNANRIVELASS